LLLAIRLFFVRRIVVPSLLGLLVHVRLVVKGLNLAVGVEQWQLVVSLELLEAAQLSKGLLGTAQLLHLVF
jgi:hypothetical protein